jgi:uncharacterized protein YuzE
VSSRSHFPSASLSEETLAVRFSDSLVSRSVEVACVVDQTDFGDVIGVEILDFRRQLTGGMIEGLRSAGQIKWSYDPEMDALYVHLTDGRSQVQVSVIGRISLDSSQRVVLLEAAIPAAIH